MPPKVTQIIVAAAIDAMIEDAIKESQKKDDLLDKLIGKKYIPQDNSYIHEIVNGKRKDWGALIGVPCEIISKPYQRKMIRVKSLRTGFIYEVMFCESWIRD